MKNDGGPVYPGTRLEEIMEQYGNGEKRTVRHHDVSYPGMSLRDWFAGMALQGLLACPEVTGPMVGLVTDAYSYADLMLKERAK